MGVVGALVLEGSVVVATVLFLLLSQQHRCRLWFEFRQLAQKKGMYYIFLYAVQLSLPIIVTEIIAEFAVGILMRLVPNINVFVINIQIKVVIGLIIILTIIPALANFMTQMNLLMMEKITQVLTFFI